MLKYRGVYVRNAKVVFKLSGTSSSIALNNFRLPELNLNDILGNKHFVLLSSNKQLDRVAQ